MKRRVEQLDADCARAEAEIERLESQQAADIAKAERLGDRIEGLQQTCVDANRTTSKQLISENTALLMIAETFIGQAGTRGEFLMVCPVNPLGRNKTPQLMVVDSSWFDTNNPDCLFYMINYDTATGVPSLVLN